MLHEHEPVRIRVTSQQIVTLASILQVPNISTDAFSKIPCLGLYMYKANQVQVMLELEKETSLVAN